MPSPLLFVLLILFILFALGGGFGYTQFGPWGLSPAVALLIVMAILYAAGAFTAR